MSQSQPNGFLIVALGASAGGLEAFEKFFEHMPADAGIAFAVAQHLAPDHASALPELLGRHTPMAVAQARDNTKIVPNRVYIIPPNATLTIKDRTLRVTEPAVPRGHRTPIDSLFRSLAEDCGENAVCIMLSGTGTDGTLGLRAIKEHGGMALAQTLESAQYDAILRSAIATGLVDHVLPVEDMPAKLLEYAAHLHSLNGKPNGLHEQTAKHLGTIHSLLRHRAGHDFSQYKESTITRRLERRMKALQIGTVEEYIRVLEGQPEEGDQLFKDLLIGVTQFFRDPEAFESLSREVIPKLFEGKNGDDQVRVGIVGCASGEEAYSIAMLLCERAAMLDNAPKIQIFATDIDERGLEMARKGRYPESVAENVSAERLERFFIKQDGAYQVKRELREQCLFSSHSFVRDPPFSRLNLISCRNVMIYLGLELQQKVLPLFHYALRPGGYLFLDPSESITSHKELFRAIDQKHRIFQRKESLPRPAVTFPLTAAGRPKQPGGKPPEADERNLTKELERLIVQRYARACVIVKENGEAVYFSGRMSHYLQHPAGSPETNVVNMARDGLRIPLRTSLHRAATSHERAVQKQISVQVNGEISHVDLTVEPLPDFQAANLYMIVLDEVASGPARSDAPADAGSEETIRSLESELRSAQEQAQSAYEELETSNEELQSANEEYQSTNEELETSKEELQSFNEELETVNAELNRKVTELDHANSDLQNLIDSTQIATIFLDSALRIKSFTPAAASVFRLITGDIGRPITDLAAQFAETSLVEDIKEVLRTLAARERNLTGAQGRHYLMRILPYRTVRNAIDGAVITFTDVTYLQQFEELQTRLAAIVESSDDSIISEDLTGTIRSWNRGAERIFGYAAEEVIGKSISILAAPEHPDDSLKILERISRGERVEHYETTGRTKEGRSIAVALTVSPLLDSAGRVTGASKVARDITELRRAENAERLRTAQFETLLNEAPLGVYLVDAEFRIRQVNPTALAVFGDIPDLIGRDFDEVIHIMWQKAYADEMVERFRHTLETGEPYATLERIENRLDRGVTEYYEWQINRIQLPDGRYGVVCYFRDISAQVHARAALRNLNEDLKHFACAASHDLQEPLRMVTIYTQLLAKQYKGKLDPLAERSIAYAVEGAHQMELLLKGLRDYWAVNEEKVRENVLSDCNRVLEEALAFLEVPIRESGAAITHDPLPTVRAEEIPLALLFKNLIGNALKYTRPGEQPRIHISARRTESVWIFSVRDCGIGIEAEHLVEIFAPFERLHAAEEYPGSGLGLAICQRIVERYGGRIWVDSTYGQGSTFHFAIPVQGGER